MGSPLPTIPPIKPEPVIDKSSPIRRFDSAAINAQLDAALNTLPDGTTGAIIGIVDKDGGAHLAVVGKKKIGPGELAWSVSMTKPFDSNKLDYAGQVRYAW